MEDDYSPFADVDIQEKPLLQQLDSTLTFVTEHDTKLREAESVLNDSAAQLWDRGSDPVALHVQPVERVVVPDLIATENELLDKVVTVLAVLIDEISELKATAESELYPTLSIFGEVSRGKDVELKDGEEEQMVGQALSFFQEAANFVERCNVLTVNAVHQLASLYHSRSKMYQSTFRHVHLYPVFDALADLFEVLVTLDAIVAATPELVSAWGKYKKMMQVVRQDPSKYGVDAAQVKSFESMLIALDQTLFACATFQTCVDQDFEASPDGDGGLVDVRNNGCFMKELFVVVRNSLERALVESESKVAESKETGGSDSGDRRVVGYTALYVLHSRLLTAKTPPDVAFYRKLWKKQTVVPIVTLFGKATWFMNEFLLQNGPPPTPKLEPKDVPAMRRAYVAKLDSEFDVEVRHLLRQVAAWSIQVETKLNPLAPVSGGNEAALVVSREMETQIELLRRGLALATRIRKLLTQVLDLHVSEQLPMSRRAIRPISSCAEMLKTIEGLFHRKAPKFAESATFMITVLSRKILFTLRPWKLRLESAKRLDPMQVDLASAVGTIESTLGSAQSLSFTRRTVVRLGASIFCMKGFMSAPDIAKVERQLWYLEQACDWQRRVREICDCSMLYWHSELLPSLLADVYAKATHAARLSLVVNAFSDAKVMLSAIRHDADVAAHVDLYKSFIVNAIESEIVGPLCREVENSLRLHQYSATLDEKMSDAMRDKALPTEDADSSRSGVRPFVRFISLPPLRIFDEVLDVKQRVTSYLEREFYNMTVLALHDWKAYGEMRNIARKNYGIELSDPRLPMGTIDSGLDVLQIMRNIHVFVGLYNYNLNQQYFIERKADRGAKHLNTININSIANSIRTHGSGMMNTCVNFTYQFLAKKFYIFTQFLFDEYIKSYLAREQRWYRKHDDELDHKYPWDRAMAFNKDIRKLGQTDAGLSFLGQFRLLITEIGNALGYVRMVRSAGMNWVSNAIQFVPDLGNMIDFAPHVGEGRAGTHPASDQEVGGGENAACDDDGGAIAGANLSDETVAAAKNLDDHLKDLSAKFAEGTDYFRVLVDVFQQVMCDRDGNDHLNTFYMMVPALTINFVEAIVLSKKRMARSTKGKEAYFTDDGFAIGVAYILAILKQQRKFESLHWFRSVKEKHAKDLTELDGILRKTPKSRKRDEAEEKLAELRLRGHNIEKIMLEYKLLMFSFSGSQIFFTEDEQRGVDSEMADIGVKAEADAGEAASAEEVGSAS